MKSLSRLDFLKGAAGTAALGLLGSHAVFAAEGESSEKGSYTYADTIKWDAQYDVVVMGMGASGMVAAKTAADNGAKVVILEKCGENEAGGNTKVCGQLFAYANGDKEAAVTYYNALAGGRELPADIVDAISEGVANMADILADEFGFNREEYVDWTGVEVGGTNLGAMSPEYPEKPGHEKMALWTTHAGVSDSYLYQGLKQNVLDRADSIDVWYESPAVKLIQDPVSKAVIGVTAERNGEQVNVRALNGVCICTGGFECNRDMVQQYLNLINYAPRGGQFNTGDGIRMAQEIGADLWHMTAYEGLFGLGGVTWPTPEGVPCAQPCTLTRNALNTGASILVGTDGNRFLNESELVRHGHLYENGIWENPKFPEKMFVIFDETQKKLIEEQELLGGEQWASIQAFDSIGEMAEAIGANAQMLQSTIDAYNSFAENGVDYQCGREAECMRAFDGEKYYAFYVISGLLNTQGGPRRNASAQVVGIDGEPIPHLYSAGECGGITVCMYQGGTNIAECITFGRIAGRNAAEEKEALPAYDGGTVVESNPTLQGEVSDAVGEEKVYEAGENQYIGRAMGMDGEVVVRVTMDGGTIANVEIVEAAETPGIGDAACEALPEQFIGLSGEEAIQGVDAYSGATITSNAIKTAILNAIAQIG